MKVSLTTAPRKRDFVLKIEEDAFWPLVSLLRYGPSAPPDWVMYLKKQWPAVFQLREELLLQADAVREADLTMEAESK